MSPRKQGQPNPWLSELPLLGKESVDLALDIRRHFHFTLGRNQHAKSRQYSYAALALTVRDRLMEQWKNTDYSYREADCRQAYYLSMEFLLGRALGNAILNLGLDAPLHTALHHLGLALEELAESEADAGLGNGGLGRLAACFIDSCATLQLPVMGYGLRYEYGMFRQQIDDGYQVEEPDHWLRKGCLWEQQRPELTVRVRFGGHTEFFQDDGRTRVLWLDTHDILAVAYDVPVPGYHNGTVNTLRLWKAVANDEFDLGDFNAGDYAESVAAKNAAEHVSMVLYPNDASENGKELRLKQQYLLASASLQDVIRQWVSNRGEDFSQFAEKNCFQLNDTHPSVAVAELMRLLLDEHALSWEEAWSITSGTMAYTNHTLLPEALERWPVRLFCRLLPRLLEIILEINARFLAQVSSRWFGDIDRLARMSLIEEGSEQQVRMAYLAVVASYSVNGVSELHSTLLRQGLFRDFAELWPGKFNNKTNGVTPRRWLAGCNPDLALLITSAIGADWVTDLSRLGRLATLADDPRFQKRWRAVKRDNKVRLLMQMKAALGLECSADALFDVQAKRIHEYKRQVLNVLHVIHLYDRIKHGDTGNWTPRFVLFAGKAAPGYAMAKLIIKLICNVVRVINRDPATEGLLRVAFLPDYRVSAMEVICPAADLSEQISTAGKEASGTGNMKLMMSGAVTIGTLDGANVEIRQAVGADNFFLFGLSADEVEGSRRHYDPVSLIEHNEDLRRVLHLLQCGHFNQLEPGIFDPILESIKSPSDPWMIAADFQSYVETQRRVAKAYRDEVHWTRMSILNSAASGRFSSDRTVQDYNRDIWHLRPVPSRPASNGWDPSI